MAECLSLFACTDIHTICTYLYVFIAVISWPLVGVYIVTYRSTLKWYISASICLFMCIYVCVCGSMSLCIWIDVFALAFNAVFAECQVGVVVLHNAIAPSNITESIYIHRCWFYWQIFTYSMNLSKPSKWIIVNVNENISLTIYVIWALMFLLVKAFRSDFPALTVLH